MQEDDYSLDALDASHPGVTPPQSGTFCQAARVRLAQYHNPPTDVQVSVHEEARIRRLLWELPDQRTRDGHANHDDAARDGAYAVSLRCVERELGLVAVKQAEPKSGADWILAGAGVERLDSGFVDLDSAGDLFRLEVHGTGSGSVAYMVKKKTKQLLAGKSELPGIAAVVRFDKPEVWIEDGVGQGG